MTCEIRETSETSEITSEKTSIDRLTHSQIHSSTRALSYLSRPAQETDFFTYSNVDEKLILSTFKQQGGKEQVTSSNDQAGSVSFKTESTFEKKL